ncbi:MAG TPA: hypothetical protein VGB03_04020 [Acidimicrobiales bacterium]|jgi:hypothetical protein
MSARTRIFAGVVVAGVGLALPAAAWAQSDDYTREPTEVRGENQSRPTRVGGTTFARDPGSLAVTGGDVLGLAAIGVGAIGVGTVLARRGRTRSTAS